jgi:hypothetical protein
VLIEWLLYRDLPSLKTLFGVVIILPAMIIVQRGDSGR